MGLVLRPRYQDKILIRHPDQPVGNEADLKLACDKAEDDVALSEIVIS
uniref:Uncharacterized protein n=1 Tax=Rhodnius prolixus TaxID=13249 RepID=T1ICG1_RHOPR